MNETKGHITLLKTGPGTSIQDLGRTTWTQFGVPLSGAMDNVSAAWVNHVLRNNPADAVLEISQPGLKLEFSASCEIAISGAQAAITINEKPTQAFSQMQIGSKSILEIGAFDSGARVYIGIRDGFQTAVQLGSRSFFKEITDRPALQKGDIVPYPINLPNLESGLSNPKWDAGWYQTELLEFYPGPDYQFLSRDSQDKLLHGTFRLSNSSSRMGTILLETLEDTLPELPTNPVYPGTVQLTSGGKLIILGRDAQVTGGYPRIMFLTEFAQSILAQKKPGQQIRFSKLSL